MHPAMKTTDKLTISHINKSFRTRRGKLPVLRDINLHIAPGEFVCLVGPSGCGKTTLLNMMACLETQDSGRLYQDGRLITRPGRERAMVFQDFALFPWLNVLDNVLFGLRRAPFSSAEKRRVALESLERVGLQDYAAAHIHELSGGMKQRVALARALAPRPDILLMDEPFSALDAMTREALYEDVQRICAGHRMTVVFVTHNVREAVCLGDRVILFSPNPGRIRAEFPILLPRPRNINSPGLADVAATITRELKTSAAPLLLQEAS